MKIINFKKFGIETQGRTSGRLKTHCPQCHASRGNKRDKSLSVNIDTGLAYCHYCQWRCNANVREKHEEPPRKSFAQPPVLTDEHVRWFREQRGISAGVLVEAGITSAQEYMHQTGKKEWCVCFNYFDGERLVNTKYRDLQKNFKMKAGAEVIPYNINAILGKPTCTIVEGEMDVLALMSAGRTDVISVPAGANSNFNWMERFLATHFDDKEIIYLCTDSDAKGVALRNELINRLGSERCRVVDLAPHKDANELLLEPEGAQALKDAFENAPPAPLEGVFTAADLDEELRTLFENGLGRGADTGLKNFDALCTFELGRLCVVSGIPGCGKSEFVDELVLRLNLRHHWRAAYFSPENMPVVYHLNKLAEKISGKPFQKGHMPEPLYQSTTAYLEENITSIMPKENYSVDNILAKARELVHRRGVRILVIDPYNRLEHQIPRNVVETQYISAFLDKLSNFAQRYRCLVILVAHPRKMNREPGMKRSATPDLYDINGSAAFFNKCDFGLVIERDYDLKIVRVNIEKVKFKHLGGKGTTTFVYNALNGRYTECKVDKNTQTVSHEPHNRESWLQEHYVQLRIDDEVQTL